MLRLFDDASTVHYLWRYFLVSVKCWSRAARLTSSHRFLKIFVNRALAGGGEAASARLSKPTFRDTQNETSDPLAPAAGFSQT